MKTEQEAEILRNCYKILDYKRGNIDKQVRALETQIEVTDRIRAREAKPIVDKAKTIVALKAGKELEIDASNPVQVHLFMKLQGDGLITISEPERKKFIARWKLNEES